MIINRNDGDTVQGPQDWFTGTVYIDNIRSASGPSRANAAVVHFSPGARTAWHTHPLGQTIYILEGIARIQRRGGAIEELRAGESAYFEPDEEHWHGAAPNRFMVHIAMQESDEAGSPVTWGEHVSDEQYGAEPAS